MKESWYSSSALALLLSIASSGCDDALADPQRIDSTRVLGARIESGGDETAAWPAPEEDVVVDLLVAAPEAGEPFGWALSVCPGAPTTRGIPECQAPAFADFSSPGVLTPASIGFRAPSAAELGGADRLVVFGAVCDGAVPVLRQPLERSECPGERTLVSFEVRLRQGAGNLNPTLRDESLRFDGNDWPAPDELWLSRPACTESDVSAALVRVAADGAEHRIAMRVSEDDRELIADDDGDSFEELWLSHLSTAGKLDRMLTAFEPDSGNLSAEVRWRSPKEPATGQVVRFYFVLRDLRGGTDFTVRTACLLP